MKKVLPSLVSGFAASVFTVIPGLKSFSCCLFVPGAVILALYLDIKINQNTEKIKIGKALTFGFLTGLFATLFMTSLDLLMTFITRNNELIASLPQTELLMQEWNLGPLFLESMKVIKGMADEIQTTGFSILYSLMIFFSNFVINSIFGLLGGLLGMAIINKKTF